jgi:nucleoid DNA-binding protein
MNKSGLIEALSKDTDLPSGKAEYDGYTGRNPKTGKLTEVKPKKLPFFKCGKELKERVDIQ